MLNVSKLSEKKDLIIAVQFNINILILTVALTDGT